MTRLRQNIKTALLAAAILLGVAVQKDQAQAADTAIATFAGGCFWCIEKDFEQVQGVVEAISGFTGGATENPTYRQVAGGGTGHIEAVQIIYDPSVVSYDQLLHLFFRSVDPTDPGGQFCDRGEVYTTAIFVSNPAEKASAEAAKSQAAADLGQTIVTPIRSASTFYPADDYHQDYYKQDSLILTRFGPRKKSVAYKLYREGCGRDARVRALWGDAAPFTGS